MQKKGEEKRGEEKKDIISSIRSGKKRWGRQGGKYLWKGKEEKLDMRRLANREAEVDKQ